MAGLSFCASVGAQTTPPSPTPTPPVACAPGEIANPPGVSPACYTPLPPEWTPRLAFYIQSMPQNAGSAPDPHYIPPPKPGEVFITVPIIWDLYQATVTYIGGVNPQTIYGTFYPVHGGMQSGDNFLAHLSNGLCFIMMRHQTPLPNPPTVLQSIAHEGDTSIGGGATSINGTKAACATPKPGGTTAAPAGDVTIEVY